MSEREPNINKSGGREAGSSLASYPELLMFLASFCFL